MMTNHGHYRRGFETVRTLLAQGGEACVLDVVHAPNGDDHRDAVRGATDAALLAVTADN